MNKIGKVYVPYHEDLFHMIEIDTKIYELVLGGLNLKDKVDIELESYQELKLNSNEKTIEAIFSDQFELYFKLINGDWLVYLESGEVIDNEINYSEFKLLQLTKNEFELNYDEDFFNDPELKKIFLD